MDMPGIEPGSLLHANELWNEMSSKKHEPFGEFVSGPAENQGPVQRQQQLS